VAEAKLACRSAVRFPEQSNGAKKCTTAAAAPRLTATKTPSWPAGPPPVTSYEISPYKSSSEDESEEDEQEEYRRAKKPIPEWAKTANLLGALRQQRHMDPDDIFQQKHIKTCSLDDMFSGASKPKFVKRGSSGNWIEDRVTWQEELAYKKAMGFRAFA